MSSDLIGNVGGTLSHMVNFTATGKSFNNIFGSSVLYITTETPETSYTNAARATLVTRVRHEYDTNLTRSTQELHECDTSTT